MHSQYGYAQVWRRGHLLVAWLGSKICAFDVLSDPPKCLWQCDSTRPLPPLLAGNSLLFLRPHVAPGGRALLPADPLPLVVAPSGVYFLYDGEVRALDAVSGKLLWKHDGLPAGSNLLGDGRMLAGRPARGRRGDRLWRPTTAANWADRPVPAPATRLATLGRQLVVGRETGQFFEVALVDPWLRSTPWQRQFPKANPSPLCRQRRAGAARRVGPPDHPRPGRTAATCSKPKSRCRKTLIASTSCGPAGNTWSRPAPRPRPTMNVFMVNNGVVRCRSAGCLARPGPGHRRPPLVGPGQGLRPAARPAAGVALLVLSATLQVVDDQRPHAHGREAAVPEPPQRQDAATKRKSLNAPLAMDARIRPQADPRKHTVEISHQQGSLQLTFTDQR